MANNAKNVMQERDIREVSTRQKVVKTIVLVAVYGFLMAMALIVLFPFYWMIASSLKSLAEYRMSVPTFIPRSWMFSNYVTAFTSASLGRLFANTLYVGVVSTILSLIITVLSAFAFARLEFKGKDAMFAALLATMMIPGELFTITNYSTITILGWYQNPNWFEGYAVLIVPFLVSVFYIYLLKQNFMQIPNELYLAAKVDGTSRFRTFTRITVPLLSPMITYVVITGFIGGFKEYTSIVGIFGANMGPADDKYVQSMIVSDEFDIKYREGVGRESAFEILKRANEELEQRRLQEAEEAAAEKQRLKEEAAAERQRLKEEAAAEKAALKEAAAAEKAAQKEAAAAEKAAQKEAEKKKKVVQRAATNAASSVATSLSRNLINSVLGGKKTDGKTIAKRAASNALSSVMRSGTSSIIRGIFDNIK